MAIQIRNGKYEDFNPNKMVTGELAVVTSGDPASNTGRTLYVCFATGTVKRIVSYEDFQNEIQNATEDIQRSFTAELRSAIQNSIAATNAANVAQQAANEAAQAANAAAEAAGAYVLGDISEKTAAFEEASAISELLSGESMAILFGKVKKWINNFNESSLRNKGTVNDALTETTQFGIYVYSFDTTNAPDSGAGVIITLQMGNFFSLRLAITSSNKMYTSVYVPGQSYGTWEEK